VPSTPLLEEGLEATLLSQISKLKNKLYSSEKFYADTEHKRSKIKIILLIFKYKDNTY
jgi:hypothetical protein